MFEYKSYIDTAEGEIAPEAAVTEKVLENTTAVFIDAHLEDGSIDADKGICIDLIPTAAIQRYTAIFRTTEHWCKPFFGADLSQIPGDTQALILELEGGNFCTVVPVVNDTCKCVLEGGDHCIRARIASWYEPMDTCKGLSLVYAMGSRPYDLMGQCVNAALRLLDNGVKPRTQRQYPEIFEYLGWCSWDSMQIRVDEAGILQKCDEFRQKQIPVKWAIIDDMWAEIRDFYGKEYANFREMVKLMHSSRMYHFEADPIRFPNGLAHCIEKVKECGLQVGMWFPTTGYWKGIDPEGEAYRILKAHLIESQIGTFIPNWNREHAYAYFTEIMGFLKDCGADFVKVDNQSIFRRQYKGFAPIGQMARQFHDAMETSAAEQFDSKMINCMGMASENMWNRSTSPISRCSDDFLPENKAWFTKHVLQCAYNSLLQGQLYWCDWDMWWTDDGQAEKNSLMRAVSGGPIYVSDMLERSRPEVLAPLTLRDGKILRCDRPGVPTADCVTADPTVSGTAMKVQNMAGEHGILAVLNLDADARPVTAQISGEQIDGFEAEEYAVYEHFSQECRILKKGEHFTVTLQDENDYKLYIFAPIHDGFAAIGRTDKFISPKTIRSIQDHEIVLTEAGPCA